MTEDFRPTQLAGSQVNAEVLLDAVQPRIQYKELARRNGRQENRYYVTFDGYEVLYVHCAFFRMFVRPYWI